MDLQYAPRVLARPAYAEMEQLIAKVAERASVGLFRRFEIMRYWQAAQQADAPNMVGPDGLHMTDRSYGCLAAELAEALARNWRAQERAPPPRPPRGSPVWPDRAVPTARARCCRAIGRAFPANAGPRFLRQQATGVLRLADRSGWLRRKDALTIVG